MKNISKKTIFWIVIAFIVGGLVAAYLGVHYQIDRQGAYEITIYLINNSQEQSKSTSKGCNSETVAIMRRVHQNPHPVRNALQSLLSFKKQHMGNKSLYNALYQSDLKIASIQKSKSKVIVKLTGTLHPGGVCDTLRIKKQLTETVKKAAKDVAIQIFINGQTLDKALSLKVG